MFVQHTNSSSAVKTFLCVLLLASRQFNEYTIFVIGKRGSGSTRQKRKYAGKVLREVDIEHIQTNTIRDYFIGNTDCI